MKRCVGDLEGNGLLDTITVLHCGVFKDIDTNEVVKFRPYQMQEMLSFLDGVDVLIMHNGIDFDIPALKKLYNYAYRGKLIDTLVMSRVLNPNRAVPLNCPNKKAPHGVEAWGYRVGRGKPEHNDWDTFSEAMLHRCSEDVEIQHLIYLELMKEAEQYGGWFDKPYRPMDMTHKLFTILQEQEEYGWRFDTNRALRGISHLTNIIDTIAVRVLPYLPLKVVPNEAWETHIDERYCSPLLSLYDSVVLDGRLRKYVRTPFLKNGNVNKNVAGWLEASKHIGRIVGPFSRINIRPVDIESADELKDLLLSLGWEPAVWNTDKDGQPTSPKLSKDDPFEGIKGGLGKKIAKRVQCKHRRSNLEGLINLVRPDGRISSVVTGLATTGRAKHSGIVNIPGNETFYGRAMRECFIAREGYVIVGTDSAGCQNRMLAARVGDPFFTKTLLEGKKSDKTSIHYVNQAAIKEVANVDVSYHNAKTLNYATLFGASDGKLGRTVGAGPEVGALIKKAIFGVAPGFQALIDNLQKEWRANAKMRVNKWGKMEYHNGFIRGLDGRPIFIENEHTLLVYLLQSDEAIMMATAYCKLYNDATKMFGPHGGNWGFLIWYHDEFQAEVKEEYAEEFAKLAENSIVWAGEFYSIACPHKGESDIGKNWYETH